MKDTSYDILTRVERLRRNAAERCNIDETAVHYGHLALQAMLDEPNKICQIDAETGQQETNGSVAKRASSLASAMAHSGLKPGDPAIVMGHNHLDLCIPYFACHFGGYPMCAIDPSFGQNDLTKLLPYIKPKIVFCQKSCEEKVKAALEANRLRDEIVIFDDKQADINAFVVKYSGFHLQYKPAEFDQSTTTAWLMLTSGTTGLPKVAIVPFKTLLSGLISWWEPTPEKIETCLAMATLQWVSSLLFFGAGPLKGFTRVQSSVTLTPQRLVALINKYKPEATAWTPYLLGHFIPIAEKYCDLSCFKYIVISGSAIDKPLLDRFKKSCGAFLMLVYGMTELLGPIFIFNHDTPFGSVGKPKPIFEFKLVDDDGKTVEGTSRTGELWVRGDAFFKGYLSNPEETAMMLTEDGWLKTGDLFYKDEQDYYYFVERKRLLIKHYGFLISPLYIEEVIKRHPGVVDACVVGLPKLECTELPVVALVKKNGGTINPEDIFTLIKKNLEGKQVNGGLFYVDSLPVTPSGKVHRAKVKEMALTAEKILF